MCGLSFFKQKSGARRKRAVSSIQPNSIFVLDVEIVVAAKAEDTNYSIPAVIDEATGSYLTVGQSPKVKLSQVLQEKGADSETTLADQISAEDSTNSTCDLAALTTAWSNFSHLTTPELDSSTTYTLDPTAVPSGLFAYFSCVDTT